MAQDVQENGSTNAEYHAFVRGKTREAKPLGFGVEASALNPRAHAWQRLAVAFALHRGRAALVEECGLGKTLQQLMVAEQVVLKERRPALLLCPVGVRHQTVREADKFGIGVPVIPANDDSDVKDHAVNVTNYEKLHKFDTDRFALVVLDESQVLKEFKSKTKRDLCERFKNTPYRLACSATPAPNEWMELGCHSEFLGIMPGSEMLSRWFINDAMRAGEYKLLAHAADDFWRWMCGWAMCVSRPSDLGDFSDEGYVLPPCEYHYVNVSVDLKPADGMLFPDDRINVHTMHTEKRQSCEARAKKAAEIVATKKDVPWIVWCDTDYEADELVEAVPDACEVRGSMTERRKEERLLAFSEGRTRIIITKPELGGLGLNWAHCADVVFVGLSYSFERFYQAVRRSWRFGQRNPVNVWVIQTDAEEAITRRVLEKQTAHQAMQRSLADAMRRTQLETVRGDLGLSRYQPRKRMEVPSWLTSKL